MSELSEKTESARELLEEAIRWNFGYVGNDHISNKRLEDMRDLEFQLKATEPDNWSIYENKYY